MFVYVYAGLFFSAVFFYLISMVVVCCTLRLYTSKELCNFCTR